MAIKPKLNSKYVKKEISIRIDFLLKSPTETVFLYRNTKTTSGIMGHKTTTSQLLASTMLSYLHILCDLYLQDGFNPVIRPVNKDEKDKVCITVFNFDKKHLKFIKDKAKLLSKMYYTEYLVKKISFEEHYNKVMSTRRI